MKCLITGKETLSKTNSTPLSREGRELLTKILDSHNEKIFKVHEERTKESNNGIALDEDTLRHFAPKIKKSRVLELLKLGEKDIIDTRDEILAETSEE